MFLLLFLLGACGNKYLDNNISEIAEIGETRTPIQGTLIAIDTDIAKAKYIDYIKDRHDGNMSETEKIERYEDLDAHIADLGLIVEVIDKTEDEILCKVEVVDAHYEDRLVGEIGWIKCDSFN